MKRQFKWNRYPGNPIIGPKPGTFFADQAANPDLLVRENEFYLYFRGQQGGHDRIGLARASKNNFTGAHWEILPEPVLDVGAAGDPDETHVLDPAAVEVDGKIYLYYSAVSPHCERSVCLAISHDGIHFQKYSGNPILIGGGPEIVYFRNRFHLFYWQDRPGRAGFEIHSAVSHDGK
ncbi:MAG: glycoside hydrolase family 32 protein, partial [Calditrichaeota bacterium]|nr:glycoside hydrolase family 32 protein [Calditrichota bacterium]